MADAFLQPYIYTVMQNRYISFEGSYSVQLCEADLVRVVP